MKNNGLPVLDMNRRKYQYALLIGIVMHFLILAMFWSKTTLWFRTTPQENARVLISVLATEITHASKLPVISWMDKDPSAEKNVSQNTLETIIREGEARATTLKYTQVELRLKPDRSMIGISLVPKNNVIFPTVQSTGRSAVAIASVRLEQKVAPVILPVDVSRVDWSHVESQALEPLWHQVETAYQYLKVSHPFDRGAVFENFRTQVQIPVLDKVLFIETLLLVLASVVVGFPYTRFVRDYKTFCVHYLAQSQSRIMTAYGIKIQFPSFWRYLSSLDSNARISEKWHEMVVVIESGFIQRQQEEAQREEQDRRLSQLLPELTDHPELTRDVILALASRHLGYKKYVYLGVGYDLEVIRQKRREIENLECTFNRQLFHYHALLERLVNVKPHPEGESLYSKATKMPPGRARRNIMTQAIKLQDGRVRKQKQSPHLR